MIFFCASDPAITNLLQKVGELWARVASVEREFHDLRIGAQILAGVMGFVGLSALLAVFLWVRALIIKKVEHRVDDRISSELKESAIPKLENDARAALKNSAAIMSELRGLADSAAGQWLMDTGERLVTFNVGYLAVEEKFAITFPAIPQILVGEANAGAWVFVKVDAKHRDRFTWAATVLGTSHPLPYTTRVQWIAISRKTAPLESQPGEIQTVNPPEPSLKTRMADKPATTTTKNSTPEG
jgi:hypothetical protein